MIKIALTIISIITTVFHTFSQTNYGSLDQTFNPNDVGFQFKHGVEPSSNSTSGGIRDFQFSPDGKIYISGGYYTYSGNYTTQLTRLNNDLTFDNTFQVSLNSSVSWTSGRVCFGLLPSGNIVLGGDFVGSSEFTKRFCGLMPSGGTNPSYFTGFNPSTAGANAEVLDILPLSDGKAIVAGKFSSFAGSSTNHIFRAGVNGGKDATFNVGLGITSSFLSSYITKVEPTTNGKLLVIGTFTSWNNLPYNGIVRLQASGALDSSFVIGTGANGSVTAIHELVNGKVLVGGNFTSFNGVACNNLCLLNADGSVDLSFNVGSGLNGIPYSITSNSAGQLFIGGDFTTYNGLQRKYFVTINQDGTLGSGYLGDFSDFVSKIKWHTDGNLYVAGQFYGVNGLAINGFARFNANGSLDSNFNRSTGANFLLNSIEKLGPNKFVVAGDHKGYNGILVPSGCHFIDSAGLLVPSPLDTTTVLGKVKAILVDSNGRILVGGSSQIPVVPNQSILYRFTSLGNLDPTFQSALPGSANDQVVDLKQLSNGQYYVLYQSTNTFYIQRLNQNGSVDSTFSVITINTGAYKICVVENDALLVLGYAMQVNGNPASSVVKINQDGTVNNSFLIGAGPDNSCRSATLLSDGNYLIGGYFTTWSGVSRKGYVVLNKTTGQLITNFNYSINYAINQYVVNSYVLPNGKILLVGLFQNSVTDYTSSVLLYPNGMRDVNYQGYKALNVDGMGLVNSLTQLPSGSFLSVGNFSSVDGNGANCIVKASYSYTPVVFDTIIACDSYLAPNGLTYTTTTDSIYHSFISSIGADSLVMYKAFVYPTTYGSIQDTACQSYTWNITNQTYTASGNYTGVTTNMYGCDSIITLSLTIYPVFSDTSTITSCGGYTWSVNGQTYVTSGYYSDTLINQYGCDSVLTIDLTVHPIYSDTLFMAACSTYLWNNGITYNQSGFYIDSLLTQNGCDSILYLDLTIQQSFNTEVLTACDSLTWIDGITYFASTSSPTYTIPNAAGCDSIITLNLTVTPSQPIVVNSTFSLPSDPNNCLGELAIDISGNGDFDVSIDNGAQQLTSTGYSLIQNLCPGVHDLHITDYCGDTLLTQFVIPVDSNYVFNNPFIDSIALDSLGTTATNCTIYYNAIDTAYIDSIWTTGNTVSVIWNIVDSNGSNFDTTSYVLNNGNGVYWLQLSVFCPTKALGDYFTVTQAINFEDGGAYLVGMDDELEQLLVEVYPNPTNNEVTIAFESNEAQVIIYDSQGKLIQIKTIHSGEQLSLKEVETGVYFFEVITEKGTAVKRVVKR